jgi:beta-phosphoglucomutase
MENSELKQNTRFYGLELPADAEGLVPLEATADGRFLVGQDGVELIAATGDRKVEFVGWQRRTLAHVRSELGYPAYYPVEPIRVDAPIQAVLMDLDGTTIHSEHFWIWIIEQTVSSLLEQPSFSLEDSDLPFVSGHSVSEHLSYCIRKYCPHQTLEAARAWYFKHTEFQMNEIMQGRGRPNAFTPCVGVKDFLLSLKDAGVKIGLVTSGLYEKAWPEILDGFKTLKMGAPEEFYDTIITAGFPLRAGAAGTLGELSPKPHPWLYAEACRVGLGIDAADRHHVIGIEDSAAGVCSVRLAGLAAYGLAGGNIMAGGTGALCHRYVTDFEALWAEIKPQL